MESGENVSGPVNVERLNERQQIRRLHHQLGVIYGRVFLTGDWEGQHIGGKEGEPNSFDEQNTIDDQDALIDELHDFIEKVEPTLSGPVHPEDLGESAERHDSNRRLFVEALKYVRDILGSGKKDVNSIAQIEVVKAIDENIHYFRDVPVGWKSAAPQMSVLGSNSVDSKKDDWNAYEGLKNITDRLALLEESEGTKRPLA